MSNRIEGERVFCYQCENEWDRANGGLQCPRCESEFVEILAPGSRADIEDPPEVAPEEPMTMDHSPFASLRHHNPWNPPDPDEGDIRAIRFDTGRGGNGGFSFSRTYTTGFGGPRQPQPQAHAMGNDMAADEVMRSFQTMVGNILGGNGRMQAGTFGGTININGRTTTFGSTTRNDGFPGMGAPPEYGPPDAFADDDDEDDEADFEHSLFSMLLQGPGMSAAPGARGPGGARPMGGPFDMLSMLLDPRNARNGDAVFSQEAFDQVMSQLMEQNQQNGAPPASEESINQLPKKHVDRSMLGSDDKAECSICMDNVDIGTEVTVLPCQHWFHFECIQSWLKEHDTCPHCRTSITPEDQRNQNRQAGDRRSSRRASSVGSPFSQMPQHGFRQYPAHLPESPSAIRTAREQYYGGSRTEEDRDRPSSERRSSRRSIGSHRDDGGGGGGVGGWIRSHMPFS